MEKKGYALNNLPIKTVPNEPAPIFLTILYFLSTISPTQSIFRMLFFFKFFNYNNFNKK